MSLNPPYIYQATVDEVVDGDTLWLEVDLGFGTHTLKDFRLAGLDAPETSTPEGKVSKRWVQEQLPVGSKVLVQTTRTEKYGRYLATVWIDGVGVSLNQQLLNGGLAKPYDGGKRTP